MKIQGSITINYLYDDETGGMVTEHKILSHHPVTLDIVQRAYLSLGYHIQRNCVNSIYTKTGDGDYIEKLHDELLNRLGLPLGDEF